MVSFSQSICTDIRICHSGCVSSSGISLSAALIVSKHVMSVGLTILMFIFSNKCVPDILYQLSCIFVHAVFSTL